VGCVWDDLASTSRFHCSCSCCRHSASCDGLCCPPPISTSAGTNRSWPPYSSPCSCSSAGSVPGARSSGWAGILCNSPKLIIRGFNRLKNSDRKYNTHPNIQPKRPSPPQCLFGIKTTSLRVLMKCQNDDETMVGRKPTRNHMNTHIPSKACRHAAAPLKDVAPKGKHATYCLNKVVEVIFGA
jgi:hypothetical protein